MMTNQNPTQNYEAAIFNQLVKISEENAVIKYKVEQSEKRFDAIEEQVTKIPSIETKLQEIDDRLKKIEDIPKKIQQSTRWIIITIAIGIVVNIFSSPVVANLYH